MVERGGDDELVKIVNSVAVANASGVGGESVVDEVGVLWLKGRDDDLCRCQVGCDDGGSQQDEWECVEVGFSAEKCL